MIVSKIIKNPIIIVMLIVINITVRLQQLTKESKSFDKTLKTKLVVLEDNKYEAEVGY